MFLHTQRSRQTNPQTHWHTPAAQANHAPMAHSVAHKSNAQTEQVALLLRFVQQLQRALGMMWPKAVVAMTVRWQLFSDCMNDTGSCRTVAALADPQCTLDIPSRWVTPTHTCHTQLVAFTAHTLQQQQHSPSCIQPRSQHTAHNTHLP